MVNEYFRRIPKYYDDQDYNTNAPSYYDDLARKQKLIELLSKKIWKYEETLDLTLEDIESRVQQRFSEWDGRIESFPDNVESLLQDWLSDGTLDHIINETIFSWKADQVDLDKTNALLSKVVLSLSEFERLEGEDDDSGVIQRAVNLAKTINKEIFIPANTYEFSQTIQMYDGVSFVGQSKQGSKLKFTGTGIAFNYVDPTNSETSFGRGCYYNRLTNLVLEGSGKNTNTTGVFGELRYNTFDNVTISDFGTLIHVADNWTNKYINCLFNRADTWYRAEGQNNAVSFTNTIFNDSRIGFEMESCYSFNFSGCNIEVVDEVLFLPSLKSGVQWTNLSLNHCYIEILNPMFDTDVLAGDGDPITSWQIRNFICENSLLNFFVSNKFILNLTVPNVLSGTFKNNSFFKKDDSKLFELEKSKLLFSLNEYFYFESSGVKRNLSDVFSDRTKTWDTLYQTQDMSSGNTMNHSGRHSFDKGTTTSFTELKPTPRGTAIRNNSLFIDSTDNVLKFKNADGSYSVVNLT